MYVYMHRYTHTRNLPDAIRRPFPYAYHRVHADVGTIVARPRDVAVAASPVATVAAFAFGAVAASAVASSDAAVAAFAVAFVVASAVAV